jgi:FKBP-type peptidyl-prolyl cis-trans isomerase
MLNLFQHPGANSDEAMSFLALLLASAIPGAAPPPAVAAVTTRSGIRLETLEPGVGPRPTRKDAVRVTYEVRLTDGTLVESTPTPAGLLVSKLIPGLTEALLLMNKGGRYRVTIPSRLAYGSKGNADGSVPANADLVFTVKLIAIGRPRQPQGR